jgi:glycosyltransferase involved in cell wall biosynthesis
MTARVSVTMPVHNGERFVGEAIESILGQTYRDLELVVVDDGSTDATPEILSRYAAADERLVVHAQENAGYVAALNTAAALAQGELLARLDADDTAEPGRIARQVAVLDAHPDVAVVGGSLLVVDAGGRPFYLARYPANAAEVRAALAERTPLAHPTVLLRRAVFDAVGGYREGFPHAEDYDHWLRIAREHDLVNLPDILARYRVHGANASLRWLQEQARSVVAARAAALGQPAGSPEAAASATLELALWWGQLLTRAGAGDAGEARRVWRLARRAAAATSTPDESRRRLHAVRARLAAERGQRGRARLHTVLAAGHGRR